MFEANQNQRTERAGAKPDVHPHAVTILMVEDEEAYARFVAAVLAHVSEPKFDVHSVSSMAEAERRLKDSRPDVVLLDLTLPDSTGTATIHRALAAARETPIVILTGLESEKMAVEALKAGAQDYVVKGGAPSVLVRAIRYAVERAGAERRIFEAERRLREAHLQLIQADKMESIGALAAGVAHEVKNPLAVMQMGIERLARRPCLEADATAAEALAMMTDAVGRANKIVQGLLSFAAPGDAERASASLHDVIRRAVGLVGYSLRDRRITVREELLDEPPMLMMNADLLVQAFVNLLLNAAQASPDGGTITIRTKQIKLERPEADVGRRATDRFHIGFTVVRCEIDDEGAGLPPDALRRLFQPFFTTKPAGQGTGLGLYVTRNICDLHGGKLELVNRLEGGARAIVTLVP